MCEILVKTVDSISLVSAERDRLCMKAGMAVMVVEDGYQWARMESKAEWIAQGNLAADWPHQGKWGIVKIPGVPASKAMELLDLQRTDDAGVPLPGKQDTYRIRDWVLDVAAVPAGIRNTILTTGEVTVTVPQIRAFLKRIRDAAQFTGLD